MNIRERLERYFEFKALGADWKTEILAGATTFITMAYILFVNPTILKGDRHAVPGLVAATCHRPAAGGCPNRGVMSH